MQMHDVAIFTRYYPPAYKGGGPIRTLEALVEATVNPFVPWVIAGDQDLGESTRLHVPRNQWTKRAGTRVHYTSADSVKAYLSVLLKVRKLKPRVIYINSFFSLKFSIIPQLLTHLGFFRGARLLLAPRGELGLGARGIKSRKKRMFIGLYRAFRLERQVYWHASNMNEAGDIEELFGEGASIVFKEDDTRLPMIAERPKKSKESLRLVFMSRIVPIKGLDILLQALELYDNPSKRLILDVYGMNEDKRFVEKCKAIAARVPETVRVNWKGQLPHDRVREVLSEYDYFVLPTKGENFGHIIAEALSVSVPVICPDTTLWTSILEAGGGYVVRPNEPRAWHEQLKQVADQSLARRADAKKLAYHAYNSWANNRDVESVFSKLERMLGNYRI